MPNTFRYDLNTKKYYFTITNNKQELDIIYQGIIPPEFKEGENLILTGYIPNINNKKVIISTTFATNHSMEVENWEGKSNQIRDKSILL